MGARRPGEPGPDAMIGMFYGPWNCTINSVGGKVFLRAILIMARPVEYSHAGSASGPQISRTKTPVRKPRASNSMKSVARESNIRR